MVIRSIIVTAFSILIVNVFSQKQANNWTFGFNAGLNFRNNAPTPFFTNASINLGDNSTISDKNGNLLFYSDGNKIWNKNNVIMQGGLGLWGSGNVCQSSLIVPQPGNDSLYYVFTQGGGLSYSIVNMNRNGGLGEVTAKNIIVTNNSCMGKITSILHCNRRDIWVISKYTLSNFFVSILVSSSGVSTSPVLSSSPYNGYFSASADGGVVVGQMKASPNGKYIATAYSDRDTVELSRFNNTSGVVTYMQTLCLQPNKPTPIDPNNYATSYGVEFSPNSKLLYVNGYSYDSLYFVQYNLMAGTPNQIQNSMIFLKKLFYGSPGFYVLQSMQLALDSKIYIAAAGNTFLDVVFNPNILGVGCQYRTNFINIDNGSSLFTVALGLTTISPHYLYNPIDAIGNCQFSNITFNMADADAVDSVKWDFGDIASGANNFSTSFNPTHIFSTQGQYLVKLIAYYKNGCASDTFSKIVYAGPFRVDLGNDTSFCQRDSVKLKVQIPNAGVTWSTGSTDTAIFIKQPGTYWVRVNLGECVASDTIVITENALPQFSLGADTIICNNANVTLAPNPNYTGSTYLWNNATTNANNTVNTAGLHWLQLTNNRGCKWRDSINISFKTLPNYNLGNDTAICQKDTIIFNATVAGATSYTWNTAATTATIKAFTTNTYWCDVNKEGCIYRDSINLTVKPLPLVNLGNDTTICEDKTYLLDATNPSSTYLWQNGVTTPTYMVNQAGTYYVTVTRNNCVTKDTTIVQYQLKPRFTLGADKLICPGLSFTLNPQMPPNSLIYLWQDGTTTPTYTVTTQGLYYVDISNYCGGTRDSILITKGLCKVYVPTAFTPNNDGVNDVFKIGGGEAVKDFKLTVFNRWGQKVFETNNTLQGWNGTVNNKVQPSGAYIYFVEYKDAVTNEQLRMKGTVMLIR